MSPTGKPGVRMKMRAVSFPDALWEDAQTAAESVGMSAAELIRRGTAREISYAKMKAMRQAVKKAMEIGRT